MRAKNKGADQTGQKRRLVCTFVAVQKTFEWHPEASYMEYIGFDTRKPAFGVFDWVRLNPAFSATETSKNIKIWHIATSTIKLYRVNNKGADQTAQMCRLVCAFVVRMQQVRFSYLEVNIIWGSPRENMSSRVGEQHRRRPACASAQSDQRLCYSLFAKYHM